jgi:hypothetical protein
METFFSSFPGWNFSGTFHSSVGLKGARKTRAKMKLPADHGCHAVNKESRETVMRVDPSCFHFIAASKLSADWSPQVLTHILH